MAIGGLLLGAAAAQQCPPLAFWESSEELCADCPLPSQTLCDELCNSLRGYSADGKDMESRRWVNGRPTCPAARRPPARVVGFYDGWTLYRDCTNKGGQHPPRPSSLDPWSFTHLNYAFAHVHPQTFEVAMGHEGDKVAHRDLTFLKDFNKDLKVYVSIAPWNMYEVADDGAVSAFSALVASEKHQKTFFKSLKAFIKATGFDGVDIHWPHANVTEYGGRAEDYANLPVFMERLQQALLKDNKDRSGLTMTLPSDLALLPNFDLAKLLPIVEFFNTLPFSPFTAPRTVREAIDAQLSTALLDRALDYFWRAGVPPAKLTLATSPPHMPTFHLTDPACEGKKCALMGPGAPRQCSDSVGVIRRQEFGRFFPHYPPRREARRGGNGYSLTGDWLLLMDTSARLRAEVALARRRCLGGVALWGLAQDEGFTEHAMGAAGVRYSDYMARRVPEKDRRLWRQFRQYTSGDDRRFYQEWDDMERTPVQLLPGSCRGTAAQYMPKDLRKRICRNLNKFNYDKVAPLPTSPRDGLGHGDGHASRVAAPPAGYEPADNSTTQCGRWHVARAGDDCAALLHHHAINFKLFSAANPSIRADSCSEDLVPGRAYCVGPRRGFDFRYRLAGCYYNVNRAVLGRSETAVPQQLTHPHMTPEMCARVCEERTSLRMQQADRLTLGLTTGSTCLCDGGVMYDSKRVSDGYCNVPCAGDAGTMCGGKKYTSVYTLGGGEPQRLRLRFGGDKGMIKGNSFGHGNTEGCGGDKDKAWDGFIGNMFI